MIEKLQQRFRDAAPKADFCSLRYVRDVDEIISVRQDVPQPVVQSRDEGAMITVIDAGGIGYAATSDLSAAGLKRAAAEALKWAKLSAGRCVVDCDKLASAMQQSGDRDTVDKCRPDACGTNGGGVREYAGPQRVAWESVGLADKIDMLMTLSRRLKVSDRIADWHASLWHTGTEMIFLSSDGKAIHQRLSYMAPDLSVTASQGSLAQTRTFGGARGYCRQGGMEVLDDIGYRDAAPQVAAEALDLLDAPNCPSGKMDVLLLPDQMILQIHESIGHPLELDRILGDERNYAGRSFVTMDMLGSYRYGSDLLDVTFNPTIPHELASYGFDDDGTEARREFVIEKGILKRALGGAASQSRTGLCGTANARACSWNRPPIDRMANLNLECGRSTLDEMIAAIDHGVLMKTNCSWSIDDSRNKFQFGCEWGQLIEGGKLTKVVRNPNYRGISATFWRSLKMVGNADTQAVMGSPFCGKGEPNQMVKVGHASPACVFQDVEVFGGA